MSYLENKLVLRAMICELEELGYETETMWFDGLSEDGFFLVIPDARGGLVSTPCKEHGEHPVLMGPMEWENPAHWYIIKSYIDQAEEMQTLSDAADKMFETFKAVRAEYRRVAVEDDGVE